MPREYYILQYAPMDQVFIGPFARRSKAEAYGKNHREHGYEVMTKARMEANITQYGSIPVQRPHQ